MLLLDTHAALWLDSGAPMKSRSLASIREASASGGVHISPVSAWEIGLLFRKKRIELRSSPTSWFEDFLALPGVTLAPLDPRAAIDAAMLPDSFHADPADRFLVATARHFDLTFVTRDRRILDFAGTGALRAIEC